METTRAAAELVARAERLVVFTGAGMSAESGVPTFRDALTGLWARFDAQALATPEAYAEDPALVWGWYEWRRAAVERVRPNAGHEAVAAMDGTVITQNVDDLHERAGTKNPHPPAREPVRAAVLRLRASGPGPAGAGRGGADHPAGLRPLRRSGAARGRLVRRTAARPGGWSRRSSSPPRPTC